MRMLSELANAFIVVCTLVMLLGLLPQADRAARRPAPKPEFCRVTYVYDGDTVAMECGTGQRTARLQGLNAPETRDAQCPAEKALGDRATAHLRGLIREGRVRIERLGFEKYGRDLIRLRIDGQDAADLMIRAGLAEPYRGGKRRNWCSSLGRG